MIKPKCLSSIPSHKARLLGGGGGVCQRMSASSPYEWRLSHYYYWGKSQWSLISVRCQVSRMSLGWASEKVQHHRLESCWYTGHRGGWGSCSLEVTEPSTPTLPTSQSGAAWAGNTSLVSPQCGGEGGTESQDASALPADGFITSSFTAQEAPATQHRTVTCCSFPEQVDSLLVI